MKLEGNNYNKKNIGGLILVGILLLSIGGVSFAYFVSNVLSGGRGASTSGTTAVIRGATLNIEGTIDFNDTGFLPGHKNVSAIKVTATGDNELIPYNLIWSGTNSISKLNYTVYKTSSEVNVSASCNKETKVENGKQYLSETCIFSNQESLGSSIASGSINKGDTKVTLSKDEFITATPTGDVKYYYVILEYPNLEEDQSTDMGASISGKVTVEESNAKPDINILAAYVKQDDGTYKQQDDIPQGGYVFNVEKSTCSNGATLGWNIENKRFYVDNLTKSGTSCYLYFDKGQTLGDIVSSLNAKETAPDYTKTATTDEGVYKIADGMYGGYSYVWRGAVNNNWVKFANNYWRIIRINGDGTLRLIYTGAASLNNVTVDSNGITATGEGTQISRSTYNSSDDRSEYVGYTYTVGVQRTLSGTASTIKEVVDTWYNNNVGNNTEYSSKVADGKFCNDREMRTGEAWSSQPSNTISYAGCDRVANNKTPTLSCGNSEDIYILKAGLITIDEVMMAGGLWGINNASYYLYTTQHYWTMSPHTYQSSHNAAVFIAGANGILYNADYINSNLGVRPVINLKADTTFKIDGNGTFNNPYVVQ